MHYHKSFEFCNIEIKSGRKLPFVIQGCVDNYLWVIVTECWTFQEQNYQQTKVCKHNTTEITIN